MRKLLPGNIALLIIDMQNDFVGEKGFLSRERGLPHECYFPVIDRIEELIAAAKKGGRKVIYTAAVYEPDGSDQYTNRHELLPKSLLDAKGNPLDNSGLCVRDSWGADIIDRLKPGKDDRIVPKPRFDAFYQTNLECLLRCREISTLVVCGVLTEVCVSNTVREAFMRDFDVIVAEDAVGSWNSKAHRDALEDMDFRYAKLMNTREAAGILSA